VLEAGQEASDQVGILVVAGTADIDRDDHERLGGTGPGQQLEAVDEARRTAVGGNDQQLDVRPLGEVEQVPQLLVHDVAPTDHGPQQVLGQHGRQVERMRLALEQRLAGEAPLDPLLDLLLTERMLARPLDNGGIPCGLQQAGKRDGLDLAEPASGVHEALVVGEPRRDLVTVEHDRRVGVDQPIELDHVDLERVGQ
jgi:hypothetical protein